MTITFFINYLNHHQVFVADEMYKLLGDNFTFVATYPPNQDELKGGEDYSTRSYCLLPSESKDDLRIAHKLNIESDVCVYGAGNLDWEEKRASTNKLSFEISERWFKRGIINTFSPRLIKWWWIYQTKLRHHPFYKLCASSYTSSDCQKLMAFSGKSFKWGYFTEIQDINIDAILKAKQEPHRIKILWVARFLYWKHPEAMLRLAKYLLDNGLTEFEINMVGVGLEYDLIADFISEYALSEHVHLLGSRSNAEVLELMRCHDIFCLTSDRNEGWGAVLNEAMGNACCPVSSTAAGATGYLIENEKNGLVYENESEMYEKVLWLINNPQKRINMSRQAYLTLHDEWSPLCAATNLYKLCRSLLHNTASLISEGPCSKA